MRKFIIALSVLVAIAVNAKAQNNPPVIYTIGAPVAEKKDDGNTKRGIAFGPELGLNMANMAFKYSASGTTTKTKTTFKPGLAVGGVVDFGFTNNIYLQPGLFFLMNGCNFSASGSGVYSSPSGSYNLNTIQLPINFLFKLSKPGKNRIFFGIGPYVAYNIGGTSKSGSSSTTLKIGSDQTKDNVKALDLGAGINAGYQFAMGLLIRAHYQMGFANLTPGGNSSNSSTTSAIGLTVGYLFGGKPKKA